MRLKSYRVEFQKRRQLLIPVHNEALSVAAMRVRNPDRSPERVHSCNTAQVQPALIILSLTAVPRLRVAWIAVGARQLLVSYHWRVSTANAEY